MAVKSHQLISDASRLSRLFGNQVDRVQRADSVIVIALIGVFAAYFLMNYVIVQRRMLRSIAKLQAGTAVIGCLGLADKNLPQGTDASRYLAVARVELRRAARIVSQLRDMGRPLTEQQKEAVDLSALLDEVLVVSRKQAQERRVDVLWEPAQALPSVKAAPDQMRQVFLNLVLNALDAMPEGGELRLSAAPTGSPAGVRIAVTDTGTGILPSVLPHIFEPFYTTKERGMGVGLYISQRVVRDHGGQIGVESSPGEGTTFTVWLPAQETMLSEQAVPAGQALRI